MRAFLAVPAVVAAALAFAAAPALAADLVEGNVGCGDVAGDDLTGTDVVQATLSADRRTLSVRLRDDDYVITAVGVKGGPDYNVYTDAPFTGLTAPPTPGGNVPDIGQWFVCGTRAVQEPPEPTDPATPSASDTPSPSPTPTPTPTPTLTETPGTGSPEVAVPVPTAVPGGGPAAGDRGPDVPLALIGGGGLGLTAAAWALSRNRGHGV